MSKLPEDCIATAFFDPQYRGVLDKLSYGNEGVLRGKQRSELPQMSADTIAEFIRAIHRVLGPSGHLFLWIDKFHLCSGIDDWTQNTTFETVDLITWNKGSHRHGLPQPTHRRIPHRPPKSTQTSQRNLDPPRHPRRLVRKSTIIKIKGCPP